MKLSDYKLIIFDLDGTLVDSKMDILNANNKTLKHFGFKPITKAQVKGIVGQGIVGNINISLKMQRRTASEQLKKEMFKYFYNFYKKNLFVKSSVYAGLPTLLKKLKKKRIKIAVGSNKLENLTKIVIKQSKLNQYFKIICGGNTFKHKKPHAGFLNAFIKKMKMKKKDCLFIGDSEHDYEAAHNSGVDFLLKQNGFTQKPNSFFKCPQFKTYKSLIKKIDGKRTKS
jgi:phosphoglycolate phosphatase